MKEECCWLRQVCVGRCGRCAACVGAAGVAGDGGGGGANKVTVTRAAEEVLSRSWKLSQMEKYKTVWIRKKEKRKMSLKNQQRKKIKSYKKQLYRNV